MAGGQDEPVAAEPAGVTRIVAHDALEQQVGRGGEAHGGSGMAISDLLDGVHRECTQMSHCGIIGR